MSRESGTYSWRSRRRERCSVGERSICFGVWLVGWCLRRCTALFSCAQRTRTRAVSAGPLSPDCTFPYACAPGLPLPVPAPLPHSVANPRDASVRTAGSFAGPLAGLARLLTGLTRGSTRPGVQGNVTARSGVRGWGGQRMCTRLWCGVKCSGGDGRRDLR